MYAVLVRICEGLSIPREYVGVSFGPGGAYAGGGTIAEPPKVGDEHVERRTVIGSLSLAYFGIPLLRFGERLAQLGLPPEQPLPSRLTMSHVHTVAAATDWLRGMARQFGGMAGEFGAAVRRYTRWLAAPGDDAVKARLRSAILTNLGDLDTAEPFAQSAVRTFGDTHHRGRTIATTLLAIVHVRAGEPRGLTLAANAIDGASTLQSIPARQWLLPLAELLDAQPGSDAHDLARKARQVATARA